MVNRQALEVWKKKLDYLLAQDAIVSGGAQKFELQQQIKECKDNILELSNQLQPQPQQINSDIEIPSLDNLNYKEHELVIFTICTSNAAEEIKAISSLEKNILQRINSLLEISGRKSPFLTAKITICDVNKNSGIRNSEEVIASHINRANILIFIFRNSIESTIWNELEKAIKNYKKPTIALFSNQQPENLGDLSVVEAWVDFLRKKEGLSSMKEKTSKTIFFTEDYDTVEHLENIALAKIDFILNNFFQYAKKPKITLEEKGKIAPNVPFIDSISGVTEYDEHITEEYRSQLKDEVKIKFPDTLSNEDFLIHGSFLKENLYLRHWFANRA